MRLPRLSLPRRRAVPLTWERLRFYLLALAVLVVAFCVGFYLFFPAAALREKIEQEAARRGTPLVIDRLRLAFPPALQAQAVRLPGILPDGGDLAIPTVRLRPLWLTLAGRSPGADFEARLLGGEIDGRARRNGPIEVRARRLTFALPLAQGSALELAGVLDQGTFTGVLPPLPTTESRFELRLDELLLGGLASLGVADGNLTLGRVVCRGDGRGNSYRIEQLEATDGEMLVTGGGSFMLSQPVENSRLNLNLTLRPGANLDPAARGLLDLFATPGRDGSYALRLSGTLGTPVFAK